MDWKENAGENPGISAAEQGRGVKLGFSAEKAQEYLENLRTVS